MTEDIIGLVVEDDSLIRMAISSDLEDAGFLVHEAYDSASGIVLLMRWPPIHIIVTSAYRTVTAGSLPVSPRFFSKPCSPDALVRSMRQMSAAA